MLRVRAFWPAAAYYAFITFLSAQSIRRLPVFFPGLDKALHFLLYLGFGACLSLGFVRSNRNGRRIRPGLVLGLGILAAGLDEAHQAFVPGRTPEASDLAVDVLGILAGWAILRTGQRIRAARRRRREASRWTASQP